ncbi:hypothetical protein [Bacillus sp. RIT 809]|uniref:phage tail protein n=1 Tax=Bacillus sp. RIT 809 TaxID=2803857 RepID=UPI0019509CA4|nr:hypothetical protein [Bacillus sp. RIT 809]MBM6648996.1 hypothetical protein [Bacillus sp. RIT 809]
MADGRVEIETRLETGNLRRDVQTVNAELSRMNGNIASVSAGAARSTEQSFNGMNNAAQRGIQATERAHSSAYRGMANDARSSYNQQGNAAQSAAQAVSNAARQQQEAARSSYDSQSASARSSYQQQSQSSQQSYMQQQQYANSSYRQQQQAARDSYNAMSAESRAMHAEMRAGWRQSQLGQAAYINDQVKVQYGYYQLAQASATYRGSTEQFMGTVRQLGAEQKRVADAQMAANEMGKMAMMQQAGMMMNMSTQASKISANYDRMGSSLLQVNKGGLMVADGLNKMANAGDAAVLSLKMLGPTANMKALTDMQNMIIQGQMRIGMVAMASAATAAIAYGALWKAAVGPDPSTVFAAQEAALTKYKDAVVSRTNEIVNAWNIFENVTWNKTSPKKLMENLTAQVQVMGQWKDNLTSIAGRTTQEFANYLAKLGPTAAAEVAAVNSMSQPELDKYVALWKEKTALARGQAVTELEGLKQETMTKIKELGDTLTPLGLAAEKFKTVWAEALKPMVQAFTNVMVPVTEFATKIGELIIKFNEANPTLALFIQGTMMLVPALMLLLSPLAAGIGLWNGILAAMNAAWVIIGPLVTGLLAMSATVWIVAAALAGLAIGFVALWNNSETFRNGVIAGWEAIKAAALAIWNFILTQAIQPAMAAIGAFVGDKLREIQAFWDQNGAAIMQAATNAWNGIVSACQAAMSFLQPIFEIAWMIIKEIVVGTWEAIKNVINGALNIIMGIVQVFTGIFTGDWNRVWDGVKQIWNGALELIWGWFQLWGAGRILGFLGGFVGKFFKYFDDVWKSIKGVWNDVITEIWFFFAQKFETIGNFAKSFMSTLKSMFSSIWNSIKSVWDTVMNAIKSVAENIWTGIKSFLGNIWNGLKSLFESVWNGIKSVASSVMSAIQSVFSTIWNSIKSVIQSVWSTITSVITSGLNAAKSVVSSVMSAIQSVFSTIWNAIKSVVSSALSAIQSVISSGMSAAQSIVSSIGNTIKSTFTNIWNGFSNIVSNTFNTVKSAVTGGLQSAVDIVKNFGSTFMNAGKGLIDMMAQGIKNAAGAVTGAISDIAAKARDFLPFSPAKTGPLSDIDKLDFGGPITDSIHRATKGIQVNLASMLELPVIGATGEGMTRSFAKSTINNNNGGNTNVITVQIDPSNMSEFEQVIEFFDTFKQKKRARG